MSSRFTLLLIATVFIIGIGAGAFTAEKPHNYIQDQYTAHAIQKKIEAPILVASTTSRNAAEPEKKSTEPAPIAPIATIKEVRKSYAFTVELSGTVIDAMYHEMGAGRLDFTVKKYPSLGVFVESIGGLPNKDGNFWFLYVNGKSSDLGASQMQVRPGDSVEWQYHQNNIYQ